MTLIRRPRERPAPLRNALERMLNDWPSVTFEGGLTEVVPAIDVRDSGETKLPGVFAAGDARRGAVHRIVVAAGEGATAVQLVHQYFRDTPGLRSGVDEPGGSGEPGSPTVRMAR